MIPIPNFLSSDEILYKVFYTSNQKLINMNKEKFNIIYEHFAKPIADMKMTYNNSTMTIEAKVVNPEVSKCFQALMDALNKQLDSYRK